MVVLGTQGNSIYCSSASNKVLNSNTTYHFVAQATHQPWWAWFAFARKHISLLIRTEITQYISRVRDSRRKIYPSLLPPLHVRIKKVCYHHLLTPKFGKLILDRKESSNGIKNRKIVWIQLLYELLEAKLSSLLSRKINYLFWIFDKNDTRCITYVQERKGNIF